MTDKRSEVGEIPVDDGMKQRASAFSLALANTASRVSVEHGMSNAEIMWGIGSFLAWSAAMTRDGPANLEAAIRNAEALLPEYERRFAEADLLLAEPKGQA